jgi:Spy/CpxP family protein refolding chaperone
MKRHAIPSVLIGFFILFACYPSLISAQPERPGSRIEKYLNLTPEQKTKLDEFRKARQEERRAIFDQMRKLRSELRESMKAPQADEKKIDSLIDEMSNLRATQLKNSLQSAREMKTIFTPEQLQKMKKFRSRIMDRRIRGMGRFMGRGGFYGHGWMNPRWGRGNFWRSGPMNRIWRRW